MNFTLVNWFYRSGAYGGSNKLDPTSSPVGSTARSTLKSELEKSVLARDISTGPIKERAIGKLNVKYVPFNSCRNL